MKEAQKSEDRRSGAGHLTRLVQFNTLVVSPVLDKIKGKDAAMKELAELLAKATEEAKKEGGYRGGMWVQDGRVSHMSPPVVIADLMSCT